MKVFYILNQETSLGANGAFSLFYLNFYQKMMRKLSNALDKFRIIKIGKLEKNSFLGPMSFIIHTTDKPDECYIWSIRRN